MQVKQLLAVLSVFMFGLSFASQAYAASFPGNFPRETVSFKDSARQRIGRQNARLAAQYRAGMLNRFLKYTTYDSQSSDNQDLTPEQIETAKKLFAEIQKFGFKTTLSEHYYIYVEILPTWNGTCPPWVLAATMIPRPTLSAKVLKRKQLKNTTENRLNLKTAT